MLKNTKLLFIASLAIYCCGVTGFVLWENSQTKSELINRIDRDLIMAAKALRFLIAPDFHDRAVDADSISFEEELRNRAAVSGLASETNIKWIYALVEKDGKFYFSAPTVSEEEAKERKRWYWYPYNDIPPEFVKALRERKTVFIEYSDQWGDFRSIATPQLSPGGKPYLACADYEISFIAKKLRANVHRSILIALFFMAITIPFIITFRIYNSRLKQLDQDRARVFFGNAAVGISIVDQDGFYLRINRVWTDYTGYSQPEATGKSMFDFIREEDHEITRRLLDQLKSGEKDSFQCDRRLVRRDGSTLPVETVASAVRGGDGKVVEILLVDVDITERILVLEERIKREKLQSAVETAGALCHELNQPLQVLLGRVEMMLKRNNQEAEQRHLNSIEHEVVRMMETTKKLQNITRYETQPYLEESRIMDIDRSTD